MSDTITIRTHFPSDWKFGGNNPTCETWVFDVRGDKVSVQLFGEDPDDNLDWEFPSEAARSLGESLIKYAFVADSRKN